MNSAVARAHAREEVIGMVYRLSVFAATYSIVYLEY